MVLDAPAGTRNLNDPSDAVLAVPTERHGRAGASMRSSTSTGTFAIGFPPG